MLRAEEHRQALEDQAEGCETPNWMLEFSDGTYDHLQTVEDVQEMCFRAVQQGVRLTNITYTPF